MPTTAPEPVVPPTVIAVSTSSSTSFLERMNHWGGAPPHPLLSLHSHYSVTMFHRCPE